MTNNYLEKNGISYLENKKEPRQVSTTKLARQVKFVVPERIINELAHKTRKLLRNAYSYKQANVGGTVELQVELMFSVNVNIQIVLHNYGMLQLRKSREVVQWVSGYYF